jgi:hypothetical protein
MFSKLKNSTSVIFLMLGAIFHLPSSLPSDLLLHICCLANFKGGIYHFGWKLETFKFPSSHFHIT